MSSKNGIIISDIDCISCDSPDCIQENDVYRCLDCGQTFERAPSGTLVISTTLWWVVRIGYAVVMLILPLNIVWAMSRGEMTAVIVGLVALVALVYLDASKVAEAIRAGRGNGCE